MKRSEFLKLSCTGCLLGATGLLSVASMLSCSPSTGLAIYKAPVADKKMTIPLAQLALKEVTVVRGNGMEYDIAVRKKADGTYEALLLRCTHFSNPLVVNGNGYTCTQHGSVFDNSGKVKKGPASVPLKQLQCSIVATDLIINV